jgi:2-dehydropantoate 2-reductase
MDELQTRVIEEALALVRARGITLPEPDPKKAIKEYCAVKFHRVSMTQHLDRGRPTEIDSLNGYVVRESRKLGLATPFNEAVVSVVKALEHARSHPYGDGLDAKPSAKR